MTNVDDAAWRDTVRFAAVLAEEDAEEIAASLLADVLRGLDPATAPSDDLLIEAAIVYSRNVEPVADLVPDDVAWARYANRAARARFGPDHVATVLATDNLASVLYVRGQFHEASLLRRDLIQLHLDHGNLDAHLVQRIALAEVLHAAGRCDEAVQQAEISWQDWISRHDPTGPDSVWIMLRLDIMLIACNRTDEAQALRRFAKFEPPSADDPMHGGYHEFISTVPATIVQHRPVCAHRRRASMAADTSGVCA